MNDCTCVKCFTMYQFITSLPPKITLVIITDKCYFI
ncbi:hypothetical protein YTXLTZUM_CDS0196 [Enterococcus phage VRE9_3]